MTDVYSDYISLRKGPSPIPDSHETGVRVYADPAGALHTLQSDGTDEALGGGSGGGGGPVGMGVVSVTITAAQLIALPTTPILILAGTPGVINVPILLAAACIPGSTPFSGLDSWKLVHRDDPANTAYLSGGVTYSTFAFVNYPANGVYSNDSALIGGDLMLEDNGTNLSAGNGHVAMSVAYMVLPA